MHRSHFAVHRKVWLWLMLVAETLLLGAIIVTAQAGSGFGYQGELKKSGLRHNGSCDMQFSLWDTASDGAQLGSTQSVNGVNVGGGLFTVVLNDTNQFGASAFTGESRWLAVAVQCAGDGGFIPLSPRTALTAVPYALSLLPGAVISSSLASSSVVSVATTTNLTNAAALLGELQSTTVGQGLAAIRGNNYGVGSQGSGVLGVGYGGGAGVSGVSLDGEGVYAQSTNGTGVYAQSTNGCGVYVSSAGYDGVRVNSAGYSGVYVDSAGRNGLYVGSAGWDGVRAYGGAGFNDAYGRNLYGNSTGVKGEADLADGYGVYGVSTNGYGCWARARTVMPGISLAMSTSWAPVARRRRAILRLITRSTPRTNTCNTRSSRRPT